MNQEYICEQEGCNQPGILCTLENDNGETITYHYCIEHAPLNGFCFICGQFWGGIEAFDFGPGFCENCAAEIEAESADSEEDEFCFPFDIQEVPS